MAAEYSNADAQTVASNQNVAFSNTVIKPTCCGCISHRSGSGLFTLKGISNTCFATFRISYQGNIAVPTGQTPTTIGLSVSIDGEPDNTTSMLFFPGGTGQYGNVGTSTLVQIPKGCCITIAVKNISTIPILVQNSNLTIERVDN